MCCCKRIRTDRSSIRMGWYHMVSEASEERFVFPARSFVNLVKRSSTTFVFSQRRSRLPCSLSLMMCAILMLVKESASSFALSSAVQPLCCRPLLSFALRRLVKSVVLLFCPLHCSQRCAAATPIALHLTLLFLQILGVTDVYRFIYIYIYI